MCAAQTGLVCKQGKTPFILIKGGGKARLSHVVCKFWSYTFFMPDLVLILTWEISFGVGFQFGSFSKPFSQLGSMFKLCLLHSSPLPITLILGIAFHPIFMDLLHTTLQVHAWRSHSCGELLLIQNLVLVWKRQVLDDYEVTIKEGYLGGLAG